MKETEPVRCVDPTETNQSGWIRVALKEYYSDWIHVSYALGSGGTTSVVHPGGGMFDPEVRQSREIIIAGNPSHHCLES